MRRALKLAANHGSDTDSSQGVRNDAATPGSPDVTPPNLGVTLLRVAWLAILLGLVMEGLLLLLGTGFGNLLGLGSIVADLVKNVSWSVFVCVGLALGTTLSKMRLPAMGLLGLLTAPLAFEVSRVLHKGTVEALALSGSADAGGTSTVLLAVVKGVEYGCLGLLLGWLGGQAWGGAAAHVAVGLAVGAVFGGLILGLTFVPAPGSFSTADLLSRAVNELLFPVGCSLVLFSARSLGERSTANQQGQA